MWHFLYCLGKNYIIIRWPQLATEISEQSQEIAKKKIALHFWNHNRWNHETTELLWPLNQPDRIQITVQQLLSLLEEERILDKKVTLQSTACSCSNNDAYLSFDHAPFDKESSTFDKLMVIESILKTVRGNGITIPNVYFLVHHQELKDPHLDFSCPWPITGFISP